jgi:flagellar biosynthesis/type III secretory pathway chaperone
LQPTESNLIDVLNEQISAAEAMLGTLAVESEALTSGDTERLNAASAGKAELVETLEQLETERRELARILELDRAAAGTPAMGSKWRQLLGLLEQCRDTNLRNGSLVQARREQIVAALKLIGGAGTDVYDARGREDRNRGKQQLGSA